MADPGGSRLVRLLWTLVAALGTAGVATAVATISYAVMRLVVMRARLAALADGEVVRVRYAIPSRLDAYEFRLRGRALDDQRVRVRVELSSFLLRLFAPDLEVDYERGSGRLLRYRGASNLSFGPPGREENPQVEILYSYPEVARTAGQEVDRHDP